MPKSSHPDLLVGFEHKDDAGVFRLPAGRALVQTIDFFTPVVDDPYAFGQIAAANALSDVYAMGGQPLTVMNVACFNPLAAPAEVWAAILQGMHDKTVEAGAVVVGGHTVEDNEPKFGMSVTGIVDPDGVFANTEARPGDRIYLTKPLGTGIVATAAKNDGASVDELKAAIDTMAALNSTGRDLGLAAGVRCATDITGFGLVGHLFNIARASGVTIEIEASALPVLSGVRRMVDDDFTTGGAVKNERFVADAFEFGEDVEPWVRHVVFDPQTSGGLALFSTGEIAAPRIGRVVEGPPRVRVI